MVITEVNDNNANNLFGIASEALSKKMFQSVLDIIEGFHKIDCNVLGNSWKENEKKMRKIQRIVMSDQWNDIMNATWFVLPGSYAQNILMTFCQLASVAHEITTVFIIEKEVEKIIEVPVEKIVEKEVIKEVIKTVEVPVEVSIKVETEQSQHFSPSWRERFIQSLKK